MFTGNVPELRVSTANRAVVLRGGRSTSRSLPSGKSSLSLSNVTCTVTFWSVSFWNVIGISAWLDVMVTVVLDGMRICARKSSTDVPIDGEERRAPWPRPPVVSQADVSDENRARSPRADARRRRGRTGR